MFKLALASCCASVATAAGWNHLASFNDGCGADLSLLRGTEMETTLTLGRVAGQFKTALQEVVKARVAMEGCNLTPQQQQLFYGFDAINILRLLDAYDTTLNNTVFPCATTGNLDWSWQTAKHGLKGVEMPTTCRSATFATTKQCNAKFRLVDNLFVELHFADTCTDPNQPGYGLPQMTLSCSGAMCASLGVPCIPGGTPCAGGATCHTFTDSSLANTMQFLLDTGLFNNITDSCDVGGFNFAEQFFSDVLNNAANLLGLTATLSTDRYHSVSMCGVGEIDTRFNPSQAPTPVPMFRCPSGLNLPFSSVCDGVNDCPGSEDELFCRCNSTYGFGTIDSNLGFPFDCCPICVVNGNAPLACSNSYCSTQNQGSNGNNIQICNQTAWGVNCPDLMASNGVAIPAAQPLSFVQSASANEHILGYADCTGNVQIGNSNDMLVANARLPVQKVLARAENIIKAREPCRAGTSTTDWKRFFFPWAVNFWGGAFFTYQGAANVFNNVNPGAKLDDSMRYYHDAKNNSVPPPFSNLFNAPASCDGTSTNGGVCELAVNIGDWFAGDFPPGWDSATTIHIKAASTCTSSAVPQGIVTCEGPCTATAKSGCCLAKEPFMPSVGSSCPTGYVLDTLDSGVTDFLFSNGSAVSQDTTLMNFVMLVATRSTKFGSGPGMTPFVPVGLGASLQFCRINGSSFDNNTNAWANRTATDACPYPPVGGGNGTYSCPQLLTGGGIQGCTTNCVQNPTMQQCPASGCPQPPMAPTMGGINGAVAAGVSAAAIVAAMLAL